GRVGGPRIPPPEVHVGPALAAPGGGRPRVAESEPAAAGQRSDPRSETRMNRYLVVANQTLESPQLREAIRQRMYAGPSTFHLVGPVEHGHGWGGNEGEVALEAEHRLTHAIAAYGEMGAAVRGEVGVMSPVEAVDNVLRGVGPDYYTEIIISTLPVGVSKWV